MGIEAHISCMNNVAIIDSFEQNDDRACDVVGVKQSSSQLCPLRIAQGVRLI